MSFELNGKTYETDEEGYLANLADWNPEIADYMAKQDDCDLSENHWEVINFLREYYDQYQIAPAVRVLTKAIGKKLGKDKGNSKYLYELFPYGPAKQACKYAGLPPWSDGRIVPERRRTHHRDSISSSATLISSTSRSTACAPSVVTCHPICARSAALSGASSVCTAAPSTCPSGTSMLAPSASSLLKRTAAAPSHGP